MTAMMKRISEHPLFTGTVIWVIIANAAAFAAASYELSGSTEQWLERAEMLFLGIYVVEMLIRLAAHRFNLFKFLAEPFQAFEFGIVVAAFFPLVTSQIVLLRLVRLLRVARLAKFMPDFRVLLDGLKRALPPSASLAGIVALLSFIWASIGWMMFSGRMPEGTPGYFDNIGEGMLTLFEFLTLEGWNDILRDLREVTPWAIVFVVSYILLATYIVVNLVLGIIINALDSAYRKAASDDLSSDLRRTASELEELVEQLSAQVEREHTELRATSELRR